MGFSFSFPRAVCSFTRSRREFQNGAFRDALPSILASGEAVIVTGSTATCFIVVSRFIDSNEVQWRSRRFQSDVFLEAIATVLLPLR